MDRASAEQWTTISALGVVGIYGYRRLTEPAEKGSLKNVLGIGNPVPLGQFITAWGFTFLVVAGMTAAAPEFGGAFAILILTSDFLANASNLTADVTANEQPAPGTAHGSLGVNPVGNQPISQIPALNFNPITTQPQFPLPTK